MKATLKDGMRHIYKSRVLYIDEDSWQIALTDMYETNTVKVEKMPRSGQFEDLNLKQGECISCNGNLCDHYNEINKTGKTRMSFDFRVLPLNYYNENYTNLSVTTKQKYIEGGYRPAYSEYYVEGVDCSFKNFRKTRLFDADDYLINSTSEY